MLAAFLAILVLPAFAAVPQPVPVAVASAAVPRFTTAPPITPELLERWSIPLEKYMALPPEAKVQLRDDLAMGERARLRRCVVVEHGRLRHVALAQTDAASVFQIDGRK